MSMQYDELVHEIPETLNLETSQMVTIITSSVVTGQ